MADFKFKEGTKIILADTTYAPGATALNNFGSRTDQLLLSNLGINAARQSTKFDFTATWDMEFNIGACLEFSTAPTAGRTVNFYIGYSNSATAGQANPGNLSGADAAYTGYSSNLANSLPHLTFLGSMPVTAQIQPTVQVMSNIATFRPRFRYGMIVVHNDTDQALNTVDAIEMSVVIQPLTFHSV